MLRTFRSWYSLSLYARRFVKTRITEQRSRQDLGGSGLGQDVTLAVISEKRDNFTWLKANFTGLKSRAKAAMLHDKTMQIFSRRHEKNKF